MKKERKPLTTREKVLIGLSIAGAVATCAAGYFGYKYWENLKDLKALKAVNDDLLKGFLKKDDEFKTKLIEENKDLKYKVTTLLEAASEGLFEDAIGTVNNKINYRVDRKKYLNEALKIKPDDKQTQKALAKVELELANLFGRKDKFIDAQLIYGIMDEEI